MMAAYYNEYDRFAAAWLRELIKAGHIAHGDVDDRPIQEVKADELRDYTQCHFFAGIGGWSLALRLALWPDDRPVWTGSPPCQPYSRAGKKTRQSDERHLWPYFSRLIAERKPPTVFGEQVASAIAAGWWDDVANDLETEGYACAAAVLPACSIDAPHERNRAFFVAHHGHEEHWKRHTICDSGAGANRAPKAGEGTGSERQWPINEPTNGGPGLACSRWAGAEWQRCADGLYRAVEPRILPLAYGLSDDMEPVLSGYGNAIVPQLAAEFIKAAS